MKPEPIKPTAVILTTKDIEIPNSRIRPYIRRTIYINVKGGVSPYHVNYDFDDNRFGRTAYVSITCANGDGYRNCLMPRFQPYVGWAADAKKAIVKHNNRQLPIHKRVTGAIRSVIKV